MTALVKLGHHGQTYFSFLLLIVSLYKVSLYISTLINVINLDFIPIKYETTNEIFLKTHMEYPKQIKAYTMK